MHRYPCRALCNKHSICNAQVHRAQTPDTWWRHQMETVFALLALCAGESTGHRRISPLKGQWRGALTFSLICTWTKGWVNSRDAGDLRYYRAHYDVIVMHQETIVLKTTFVIQIPIKFRFALIKLSNRKITAKFCTRHNSHAVAVCNNMLMSRNHIRTSFSFDVHCAWKLANNMSPE